MDSDYASVVDQAGIYAGKEGFDITVGKNTDLTGAVIDSNATPDKNKLDTGTITFSDIENKAEYSASNIGIGIDTGPVKDPKNPNSSGTDKKDAGVTPDIGIGSKDDAKSTTKSGVAAGTIEVTDKDKQKQDINKLNRDTKNTLNKLEQIFDKQTVQERQELAKVFGEVAYKEVHRISKQYGWAEGSPEKIALHTLIGGIMAQLGGGDFASGATAAGVNEAIQNELSKIKDPALHQWASAIVGAAVAEAIGGDGKTGASTAASGTKNNNLEEEKAAQRGENPTHVTEKNVEEIIAANGDNIQIVSKDGESGLGKDIGITVLTANAAEGVKQLVVSSVQKSITYGTFYTNHGALDYAVDLTPTTTIVMTGMVNMGLVENGMTLLVNYSQMNTLEEFAKKSTVDITTSLLVTKGIHAGLEAANIKNTPIVLTTTTGAIIGLLVSNRLLTTLSTESGENRK